jgi:hypothetical protein
LSFSLTSTLTYMAAQFREIEESLATLWSGRQAGVLKVR